MFTFVTITYNHEKYIIEHLESIRYQIENYSEGKKMNLIVSDDGSVDNTMRYAQQWVERNKNLFSEVEFLTSEKNQGIVKNYLSATAAIKTPAYKLLAGDDLYYKNNIFRLVETIQETDIIFTPALNFNEDTVWNSQDMNRLLTLKTLAQIKKVLKFQKPFNTPGAFYSTDLIQDEGLRAFISKYTWIEDLPSYYYLFNKRTSLNYSIQLKPYILYRSTVGISNNKKNEKNNVFTTELNAMEKDLGMVLNKYPKYFNPYQYYWKLSKLKLKYRDAKTNHEIGTYNKILNEEAPKAQDFLQVLRIKSTDFLKSLDYSTRTANLQEDNS